MGLGPVVERHVGEPGQLVGVVGQVRVLADAVDHVDPEAVDAAVEPEAHHVVHRRLDLGVGPVQVGLLGEEEVQVVLPGGLVEGPRRARG